MNSTLTFPVALLDTDVVPVVCHTFGELAMEIEPQDVDGYRIVDATGAVFRVLIERDSRPSWGDRLASFLGAPERYAFQASTDALPPDVVETAKEALAKAPRPKAAPEGS